MRQVQTKMHLLGKAARRILQWHYLLWKNLWPLIAHIHLTDNKNGAASGEQVATLVIDLVHAQQLHGAFQILERNDSVRLAAFFGDPVLDSSDKASNACKGSILHLRNFERVCQSIFLQNWSVGSQWMPCDIEA